MSLTRLTSQGFAPYLLIALLGAVLFIPFLGGVHLFDWDEINFAEAAREMVVTGNYSRVQINFQPFWEKPPLFFWMQAACMHIFGINEFAARFPNTICGILTFCLIFFLGKRMFSASFGWLWILVYAGSFLPHFYFKSGIIDPWFNLFIFAGISFLTIASEREEASLKYFVMSGASIGLAILTKGPVALLVTLLTAGLFLVIGKRKWFSALSTFMFFIAMLLVASIWFLVDFLQGGAFFISEFIRYQVELFQTGVAGHSGPFYYHAVVLFIGCFPASIFALSGFVKKHDADERQRYFRLWMLLLFFVVLVLFSIVKTKIVHYSSLCYLPLTFLAAWEIHHRIRLSLKFTAWQVVLLAVAAITIGIAASSIPYFGHNPAIILPYISDAFTRANLEAQVQWQVYLLAFGFIYWILMAVGIFRVHKGWLKSGVAIVFITTCLFIQSLLFAFVPRMERYTQGAAIDFYKTLQGKDVYVEVLEFKSYAHLFYTAKQPQPNPESNSKDWLLLGAIDKPAYFVCKINKADVYKAYPGIQEIGRKNGFVFLKREPVQPLR